MDKPIVTPVQKLLSSRKFILAMGYIVAQLLVRAAPDLRPYIADLTILFTFTFSALFLHLSIEDIIKLIAGYQPTSIAAAERDAANEALDVAIAPSGTGTITTVTNAGQM